MLRFSEVIVYAAIHALPTPMRFSEVIVYAAMLRNLLDSLVAPLAVKRFPVMAFEVMMVM